MSPLGAARGRARPHLPSHWPAVPPPLLKDLPQPLRGTEFSGKHCFCDRNQDGSDEAVLGNGAGGHRGAYPVLDVGHRGRSEAEAPAGSPRDFIRDRKTQDTAQTSFCPEPCWPHSHSEPPPPPSQLCVDCQARLSTQPEASPHWLCLHTVPPRPAPAMVPSAAWPLGAWEQPSPCKQVETPALRRPGPWDQSLLSFGGR